MLLTCEKVSKVVEALLSPDPLAPPQHRHTVSDVITLTNTDNPDDIYDDPPQRPHHKTTQSLEQTTQSTTQSAKWMSQPSMSGIQSPTNAPAVASKPVTPMSQGMSNS
jgi:hypothetical protein